MAYRTIFVFCTVNNSDNFIRYVLVPNENQNWCIWKKIVDHLTWNKILSGFFSNSMLLSQIYWSEETSNLRSFTEAKNNEYCKIFFVEQLLLWLSISIIIYDCKSVNPFLNFVGSYLMIVVNGVIWNYFIQPCHSVIFKVIFFFAALDFVVSQKDFFSK